MPQISVIVPVYKVEKYLRRCVDSILEQSFWDFEVILVDDGDTENCSPICDGYAILDDRIKVIHKTNGGIASARNAGLDIAQGKWVLFCDSDDCYNADELSRFLSSVDLRCSNTLYGFNFYDVWENDVAKNLKYTETELDVVTIQDRIDFISCNLSHKTLGFAVWDKLYSKEIIDRYHIRVLERDDMKNRDDWAEDLTFNLQYFMCAERISVSERPVYLLTKHGTPSEQNEDNLVGRLDHMIKIFLAIQNTPAYKQSPEIATNYWKIVIWHLRRYLYIDADAKGVDVLRRECMNSPYSINLMEWIDTALLFWDSIKGNWGEVEAADYQFLLQYLHNGNKLMYKLHNYWLWKIKPAIQQIMRRKW